MKKWHWILLAVATAASLVVEFTMHHDANHWWSSIPMFWIIFGFVGCSLIIVFAKVVLTPVIYKKEDYYNE